MKYLWLVINHTLGKHNNKTTIIESIKVNNIHIHSSKAIANELANYFATIGKVYANHILKSNDTIDTYLLKINKCNKSIFLHPTTKIEIKNLIDKLPNKKSSGPDGVSNCFLKEIKDELLTPLEILFNQSLNEGIFPQQMKLANVVPLHKSKSKFEAQNYRPISLLLTISKILEKVMYKWIYQFLTENDQIYISQHGFRNKHSCETAICKLVGNTM